MRVNLKLLVAVLLLGLISLLMMQAITSGGESRNNKSLEPQKAIAQAQKRSMQAMTTLFPFDESLRSKVIYQFEKRKERVLYMCDNIEDVRNASGSAFKKTISNIIVDTEHSLTWCPIYKVASSVWMKNFAILSGFSTTENLTNKSQLDYGSIVRQKFQRNDSVDDKLMLMSLTVKFMMVRHPFERLLSAYRDKLEHMQGRDYYYKRYGKYIKDKYRAKHSNLTSLEPSFKEFLQFIAKERLFDEHWTPFYRSCQPCSIEYNYILKFESLKDEYNVFLKQNDLDYFLDYMKNDRENTSSHDITNDKVAEKYFKDIPESLLLSIFKIYELDFLLFDYSPVKYYYMSSHQKK